MTPATDSRNIQNWKLSEIYYIWNSVSNTGWLSILVCKVLQTHPSAPILSRYVSSNVSIFATSHIGSEQQIACLYQSVHQKNIRWQYQPLHHSNNAWGPCAPLTCLKTKIRCETLTCQSFGIEVSNSETSENTDSKIG